MRKNQSLSGLLVLLPMAAALSSGACAGDFEGCQASRSCPETGKAGQGGAGGSVGTSGKGGGAVVGGGEAGEGGEGGEAGVMQGGGKGGTSSGTAEAGMSGQTDALDEGGMGGEAGSASEPQGDSTPPTIVSVTPEDGAMGVGADAPITVTFSEPMRRSAAQAGYQSADLSASSVTFDWSDDSTVLTIQHQPLTVAEGTDPSDVVAAAYHLAMTDTAEDLAGNRMAQDFDWTFTTVRRISQILVAEGDHVRHFHQTGNVACGNHYWVGDDADRQTSFALTEFDLSDLPGDIAEWEVATFDADVIDISGDPTDLGLLDISRLHAVPLTTASSNTPFTAVVSVANVKLGHISKTLLPALQEEFQTIRAAAWPWVQYRISFRQGTDGDDAWDWIQFPCHFELRTRYLVP